MSTYLICSQENRYLADDYIHEFTKTGSQLADEIKINNNILLLFSNLQNKRPIIHYDNKDFIIAIGCEFNTKTNNAKSWINQLRYHSPNIYPVDITEFTSTLIIFKNNILYIYNDNLSCNKTYKSEDSKIISNSFLAVCHQLKGSLSVHSDSIYEYLINGSLFGTDTFFNEVNSIPHDTYLSLSEDGATIENRPNSINNLDHSKSLSETAQNQNKKLEKAISMMGIDQDTKVSFSGGYDSRLLLSLLKSRKLEPDLFVYGNQESDDVKVAKNIAYLEKLSLTIIDKSAIKPNYSLKESLKDFYAFDGWKVEHGIFDGGIDRLDRLERNKNGKVSINGSLGEIYRNFYYMPKYKHSLISLVHTFYSQYDPSFFTDAFDENRYEASMVMKMSKSISKNESENISRSDIEKLYPYFRGRFWAGRDVRLNNNFGAAYFPFMHESIIKDTDKIPLKMKDKGTLQAEMIKNLDRDLASYQSDYGFNFVEEKPLSYKISYLISIYKPSLIRKYSLRIKNMLKKPVDTNSYLITHNSIIRDFKYLKKYIVVNNIKDEGVLGLVITLEFLFQYFSVNESS